MRSGWIVLECGEEEVITRSVEDWVKNLVETQMSWGEVRRGVSLRRLTDLEPIGCQFEEGLDGFILAIEDREDLCGGFIFIDEPMVD